MLIAKVPDDVTNIILGQISIKLDYNNAIIPFTNNITSPTTYIAPNNGIFFVCWAITTSGNDCYAAINGFRVAEHGSDKSTVSNILCNKGDIINFVINNAKIFYSKTEFIPFK